MTKPRGVWDETPEDRTIISGLKAKAMTGWYLGDMETLRQFGGRAIVQAREEPELLISLLLSRDRMHHSVGWWRNAEYEYCWHLSMSAMTAESMRMAERKSQIMGRAVPAKLEDLPRDEVRYWAWLAFGDDVDKVWHEPGGTDPRLTAEEAHAHATMTHLRMFLDPVTLRPFIPEGEVYTLTRWIDGMTPAKVDR